MTNTADFLLTVDGLSILRGPRYLCRDLEFTARAGAMVHVRGPNGSGKTSLMRTLAGLVLAESGSIKWFGQPLKSSNAEQRANFAYLGHANGLKSGLTPRENLRFSAALNDGDTWKTIDTVLEKLDVLKQANLPCRFLSAGQKRRVAFARIANSTRTVWLLDEPFTCLDATGIASVTGLIGEKLKQGGLVIMSSHQEIPLISDRLVQVSLESVQ